MSVYDVCNLVLWGSPPPTKFESTQVYLFILRPFLDDEYQVSKIVPNRVQLLDWVGVASFFYLCFQDTSVEYVSSCHTHLHCIYRHVGLHS